MNTSTFSRADNARRAAHKAIADGTAPSGSFTIERADSTGAIDGRFVIVWRDLGGGPSIDQAASPVTPVEAAAGSRAISAQTGRPRRRGTVPSADQRARKPPKSLVKVARRPRVVTAE